MDSTKNVIVKLNKRDDKIDIVFLNGLLCHQKQAELREISIPIKHIYHISSRIAQL